MTGEIIKYAQARKNIIFDKYDNCYVIDLFDGHIINLSKPQEFVVTVYFEEKTQATLTCYIEKLQGYGYSGGIFRKI